jgi:hypothetical protein
MSPDALIANKIKNRNDSFDNYYGRSEKYSISFSGNPNYIADKLLCNKLRKLLRIKIMLTIVGAILIIPIFIAGILVVKHVMM